MRWLEFLGIVPKAQRDAIRLLEGECWLVEATRDAAAFYRALTGLAPAGSVLYLEGSTESQVPAFLESRAVSDPIPIVLGTILPATDRHHVAATPESLEGLAAVIEAHGIALPAIHTHLYRGRQVLVEWYDAFVDDPIYVSALISESAVARFAAALGCAYRWAKHAA